MSLSVKCSLELVPGPDWLFIKRISAFRRLRHENDHETDATGGGGAPSFLAWRYYPRCLPCRDARASQEGHHHRGDYRIPAWQWVARFAVFRYRTFLPLLH